MIGLQENGSAAPPRAPGSRSRERTAQAVEYYNTHLQKARVNAGLAAPRASFNDRHHQQRSGSIGGGGGAGRAQPHHLNAELLYRSNSSLELVDLHAVRPASNRSPTSLAAGASLRREYGSHGSIDVIGGPPSSAGTTPSESFFAMLQDYRPAVLGSICTDQRSPGPNEYLRKADIADGGSHTGHQSSHCIDDNQAPQSPKLRMKLPRFWGSGSVNNSAKNQRSAITNAMDDSALNTTSSMSVVVSAEAEEIARRRAFAHYDCQSLTTHLGYAVRIRRNLLAKRRNTTTGASAASMVVRSSTPDGVDDEDFGDGQGNDLVDSCPFFRNEIGGEEERVVCLTRMQHSNKRPLHRPYLAYGVAVLEYGPGETHWRHSTCPYQRLQRPIENVDQGALYYRKHFMGQDHQNWFGIDEQLGPVAISIRREKVPQYENQGLVQYQYRLVVRTSELLTLRGAILEDAIPNIKASSSNKSHINTKEVLEYVAPEIQLGCLRLGTPSTDVEQQLAKLDEQGLTNTYKVGIMYCKAGQSSEEEMYNNEEAEPAFTEFLETIGKKVRLNGFEKYKAGLDNKTDSTGLYSVYSEYKDCEIMFHVSTMLPYTKINRQQLLRKRHIGNDIVTIIFQEPGALPFTPRGIRSNFQHVFIIVRAINPCTENTLYSVAVSRSKDLEPFGPPIKDGAVYPKGKAFAEFLLAKIVNAENAAHRSDKFVTMATRTRQEYIKDLVANHATTTPVDSGGGKFNLFSKKKEKIRLRFIPDITQRGAILWQVWLDDRGQSQRIECFLGISADTLVLIEELSRQIVFVAPCKSILGWSKETNHLRLYHHQGECLTIYMRDAHCDRDELIEVVDRLQAVTQGVKVETLTLNRNIMKQLGFHVQPDGIVTLVESAGPAATAGLQKYSRLVEICTVAVSTLTYDQMVDLLKTSSMVTLTVIPPLNDSQPRKGCTLPNCKYTEGNYEAGYESADEQKTRQPGQSQCAKPAGVKVYDRSFSPPRSSNSSGYGTGNSKKSFLGGESRYPIDANNLMEEERWLDDDKSLYKTLNPQPLNTYPTPTKRNNGQNGHAMTKPQVTNQLANLQLSQSHNHFPVQHNKIYASHSLPLQHVNYTQPLSAALHSNTDYEPYKFDKNNILKQHNERQRVERVVENGDYMVTRPPKVADYTSITHISQVMNGDGHSTDSSMSDRLYGVGSEEELSNGSGNVSPRGARRGKHLGSMSMSSSRNQSPRSVNGEAKLRPGVTSRAANRNSANISNNLQEELIRLISPDDIENSDDRHPREMNGERGPNSIAIKKESKSRSRENLNNAALSVHKGPEVIFTTARPATVISNSSTTSSPLSGEFKSNTLDRLSPRVTSPSKKLTVGSTGPDTILLPQDMDWNSLVDTANRVVGTDGGKDDRNRWSENGTHGTQDVSINSNLTTSSSDPELRSHVNDLETRMTHETRRRLSLEEEVRRLKDENRKLQDQAHAAIQQLRKFTEWFFKNVQSQ